MFCSTSHTPQLRAVALSWIFYDKRFIDGVVRAGWLTFAKQHNEKYKHKTASVLAVAFNDEI